VDDGSRPFIVADQPFSLVPNDEARKGLWNSLLISAYPRAAKDQHSIIISRSGLNRLPGCHRFELPMTSAKSVASRTRRKEGGSLGLISFLHFPYQLMRHEIAPCLAICLN
jgi:hypothetical protein